MGQRHAGETECVCNVSACVPSCPSLSSLSWSKRLAFEPLWKWSMPYGQSRCGLTWFGFNTSPQEVCKASRSSFVILVIFLKGPMESSAWKKKVITLLFPVSEFPHMISGNSICHSVILSSHIFLIQGTCYSNSSFLTICSKFNYVNVKDLIILEIILYNIENRSCLFPEIHCYNLGVL